MANAKPTGESSYVDLSATINARSNETGAVPKSKRILNLDVDPTLKETVVATVKEMNLEANVKAAVQDSVKQELEAMTLTIGRLTNLVGNLLITTQQPRNPNNNGLGEVEVNPTLQTGEGIRQNMNGNNVDSSCLPQSFIPFTRQSIGTDNFPSSHFRTNQPQESQTNHTTATSDRIRLDKFGLKFDGGRNSLAVEDFVFRVEYFQSQYRMSWEEIMRDFHLLVTGEASNWYWLFISSNRNIEWLGLRHALMERYRSQRSHFDVMHDLVERKQQPGESLDAFFYSLNFLRSKLLHPISEYDIIKIAKRNLRETVGRIVYPINVNSLEHLRVECLEAEKLFLRKEIRPNYQPCNRPQRNVNEVVLSDEEDDIENEVEVSEIGLVCWNCNQQGHVFRDCNSNTRGIFCYKCGRKNTKTPQCPKCRLENSKRNVIAVGESRSENNPPRQNL